MFLPGLCSWWSLLVEICRTTDTLNGVGHSVYILFATVCCHTGRVSRNVFFTDLARAAFTYPFPMDQLSPSYYQVAFTILTKQIGRSRAIPSSKVHKPCIEGFLFLFKRPVHSQSAATVLRGSRREKKSYHQRNQALKKNELRSKRLENLM